MSTHRSPLSSIAIAIAIAMSALAPIWAFDPPTGADTATTLASPELLAGGYSASSTGSPMADLANPAASGLLQRTTLDFSYLALVGFGTESGWGHVLNAGIAAPQPYGVWTGYLGVISSPFASMDLGTVLTGRVGMAKDLFKDLLVGAALDVQLGTNGGLGWGADLDLGVLGIPGDVGAFKGVTWGVSLHNLGMPFSAPGTTGMSGAATTDGYASPFTPQVGVSADLVRAEAAGVTLSSNADLWFPTFQNLVFAAGLKLGWRDKAFVRLGWDFNMRESFAGVDQSLMPSFGIGASFAMDRPKDESKVTETGLNRSEIRPSISASRLYGDIWAIGGGVNVPLGILDKTPPVIAITYPTSSYDAYFFSPNNDGVLDAVTLPLSITDQRYVQGFALKVLDSAGAVVRIIANKESRPENQDLKGLVARLVYVKKGVDVPAELVWNGLTDSGALASDGRYSMVVEAFDDNGNLATTEPWFVVIDTLPPSVKPAGSTGGSDAFIFSPDGDGSKDTFSITQEGSAEDLWKADVLDAAGAVIRTWKTQNAAPALVSWDGKNDSGQVVPDGVYAYRIASTDRAGNAGSAKVENIIVNTQQPPVGVAIDMAAFSPNGDGVRDVLSLLPNVPVRTGISTWKLSVLDADGKDRWSVGGSTPDSLAARYQFNGKDSSGTSLPEGTYRTRLSVTYVNGHGPVAYSPSFIVDTTAPKATATVDRAAFNPLGDANTKITITQSGSEEDRWTGEMVNAGGAAVKTWTFLGTPDKAVQWDGSDDAGKVVADGSYTYRLSATDRAGNATRVTGNVVLVDTEKKQVRLALDRRAFSPNSDGVADSVVMSPESQSTSRILSWKLTVLGATDAPVRGFTGTGTLPAKITWDGKKDDGTKAPDGAYRAALEVRYVTNEVESARSVEMMLDTVAPSIKLSAEDTLFSPDGDGRKDVVKILQESVPGDTWDGAIVDASGKTVRSWTWKDTIASITWDGSDTQGNKVPDGTYRYSVRSEDPAGNKTERSIDRVAIDTRPTQAFVTASAAGFSPNGDGAFDDISFGLVVKLQDGIDTWRLALADETGKARRTFSGKGATMPARLVWDGKADDGTIVQSTYTAVFTVDYLKGDRAEARSSHLALDIDGPKVSLTTSPQYFSPDNDGVDDELKIALSVVDASVIDSWRFDIIEVAVVEGSGKRAERPFFTWSGRGKPAERLVWDGRSQKGELVEAATDYPYRLTIVDVLGNQTVVNGSIAVDVLVIRDGEKLKIKVPSIVFRANFPDFKDLSQETVDRNTQVLKRIAEILNRFKEYKIRVEGHANSISKMTGLNQAAIDKEETTELLPLSKARAEAVMQKLIEFGVDAKRLSVRGLGSSEPVVAFTDAENRWKNRRVEFILLKE